MKQFDPIFFTPPSGPTARTRMLHKGGGLAGVLGAVVGGILGGPMGAISGFSAGSSLGGQGDAAKQQKKAQDQALANANATAKAADEANNRANQKQPDTGAILSAAQQAGKAGGSGTMLTGPQGVDPSALTLGKSTLLGQ